MNLNKTNTAITIGSRHGIPVIYEVLANEMYLNGYDFFQSVNGIWLTKIVPIQYLKKKGCLKSI